MNLFSVVFIIVLFLATALQIWLARRQIRHVRQHRARVPEAFESRIETSAHHRGADYTIAKTRFGITETVFGALLLLGWTLGGGLELLDRLWLGSGLSPLLAGSALLLSVFLISGLLDMPLDAWKTFILERRFGFNRTSKGLFISDALKQGVLLVVLGLPLSLLVLWLMASAGRLWWLYVWAVWVGFGLLMMWAYPAFIAPLFNKFTPLEDPALVERIQRLFARCGFSAEGLYVMDGSRRSNHGNAYFTGLGRNKRIVFYDTLLKSLDADEIEAVLAHELGHFRRHHVRKRFLTIAAFALAGLALLGYLAGQAWFYQGLGVSHPSTAMALLLFLMVSPVFTFFIQPLLAWGSRRHEFEADEFAAEQTDGRALIKALVKLYEENASTLTPDPLYSAFHDTHPPAPVRVAHLSTKLPG